MAKFETTWDTYLIFQNKELENEKSLKVDAIARPTKPYVEMSFGQGKNGGFPVCNVTQFAARAYCKWLYQNTGIFIAYQQKPNGSMQLGRVQNLHITLEIMPKN